MKAARYYGRRDIRIDELPSPEPGDDELLINVSAVGICGTDAAEYAAGPTLFPIDRPHPVTGHHGPMVPGHEFSGIVAGVGRHVRGFAEGDLVTSGAGVSCGRCTACRAGRTNLCERYYTIGLNRDGALAERTTVPAAACLNLSARRITGDVAAMAQPMSTGVHAMRRGQPRPDDHVVVVGTGGIGAFLVYAAAQTGAHVTAIDLDGERLAAAAALGASATIQTSRDTPLEDQLASSAPDAAVIYECTGHDAAAQAAVAGVRPGGRVVVVGLHKNPVPVDLLSVSLQEKEVIGTLAHVLGADLGHAVDLLEEGIRNKVWDRIAPTVLPLDDLVESGLKPMIEGGHTPIKLLLDPQIDRPRDSELA